MAELARFVLHRGKDPFTPPQTKVDWVNSSIPAIKVPVVRYKYMNSEVAVVVNGPDEQDVRNQLENCLRNAAIKGLITGLVAGYATGGTAGVTAGLTTFVASLDACVENALQRELNITGEVQSESHWDPDWR